MPPGWRADLFSSPAEGKNTCMLQLLNSFPIAKNFSEILTRRNKHLSMATVLNHKPGLKRIFRVLDD